MIYELSKEAQAYVSKNHQELVELIKELCGIPAPSNHEEKRAKFCKQWLENIGAKGVYIDEAHNVVYPINCEGSEDITVFMAHTDTVFPDTEPMSIREEGGRLYSPGVGDDTANVAMLLMIAKYATDQKLTPKGGWIFVYNSGEEGLGNLKGSRKLMETYEGRVKEVYSFDGGYKYVWNYAVGSTRYRVSVGTEGGHSYMNFGNRNAIAYLSSMIQTIYSIKVPADGKTTFNVGTIKGGTSVNTIAEQAEMLFEFRSDIRENLAYMEQFFDSAMETYRKMGIKVDVEVLGRRPCMGDVDPVKQGVLDKKVRDLMVEYTGFEPQFDVGSTDCNIPFSMGIPAICFGGYLGGGTHTREEWIEIESLKPGFKLLMATVLSCHQ